MKTFLLFLLIPLSLIAQESADPGKPSSPPGFPGIDSSPAEDPLKGILKELQSDDQSTRALISDVGGQRYETGSAQELEIKQMIGEWVRKEDKQALRDLKAIYEKAIAEKDLELIKPHLADDFTAVMITADEVKDYDGIKAYWAKVEEFIGKDGTYTVSVEPDDTIFEGNIAITKGIAKEHVVRGGKKIDLTTRWTAIARKEGESWKLVRIQATIDPVNNPIITVLNKGKLWLTGGVAGIVGLVIGLLWRRRSRRVPAP